MDLFADTIRDQFPDLHRQGVRVRFVGRRDRCPPRCSSRWQEIERVTADNQRLELWVAFDYGGRDELVRGRARADRVGGSGRRGRRARCSAPTCTLPRLPDPDLVIRTTGELRLSNFLLWQSAYAELHFTSALWPDFGEEDLREALEEYASRRRRYGRR